jgi:glycerol-3-phosphate dehydrogenase (NAD(P)+)
MTTDVMLQLTHCRTLGYRLGKGESMSSILEGMHGAVAEGVSTTRAAKLLADSLGLQVPIIQGLYKILYGESNTCLW